MNTLSSLVDAVSKDYKFNFSKETKQEILSRLQLSGKNVDSEIHASQVGPSVDMIVAMASHITGPSRVSVAASTYSSLKQDSVSAARSGDGCGICGSKMGSVALANSREAKYCASCHVVMPSKVD